MIFWGGGIEVRVVCAAGGGARRTARSGGVLAPTSRGARALHQLCPARPGSKKVARVPGRDQEVTRVTAFWLPKPTPSLVGGPIIRSRLLDAPARAARAVKPHVARVWNHERVTSKRRGTRRAVAGAVLHRRRSGEGAARRSGGRDQWPLLFPPGRRPRRCLPAAPAAGLLLQRKMPVVPPLTHRARLPSHEFFRT